LRLRVFGAGISATLSRETVEPESGVGPQRAEWQHIGNQINAAMIFARSDLVNVHGFDRSHRRRHFFNLITRFLRTNIGSGWRPPVMYSLLSPVIDAMRALNSSVLSTARFIAAEEP
jgi:hypothetical protein